jgi:hypothetical protein
MDRIVAFDPTRQPIGYPAISTFCSVNRTDRLDASVEELRGRAPD